MRSSETAIRHGVALAFTLAAATGVAHAERPSAVIAAAAARPASVETLERVVAVVDERPLLLSDVRTLAVVRGLEFEKAREAAVDERLMSVEASRLAPLGVSAADENEAAEELLRRRPELREAVPRPDLLRLVRRQLTILKYVEFRFRPQVRVSDDDVRKAWEAEEVGRPSGLALEDAQDAIRARLERAALDQRIEGWVGELRSRAQVRMVDPPAEPAPATHDAPR